MSTPFHFYTQNRTIYLKEKNINLQYYSSFSPLVNIHFDVRYVKGIGSNIEINGAMNSFILNKSTKINNDDVETV